MTLHPTPSLPWSSLSCDIFEWNNRQYLVLVDAFSGWFEFDPLTDISSKSIINILKRHFATHGIPQSLISDNGRQFVSEEFRMFAEKYNFQLVTSSPNYPQSNGLAERAVRSAKHLLEKTKRDNSDIYLNLINIRNMPRKEGSQAQLLMSRTTRYVLPIWQRNVLNPKLWILKKLENSSTTERISKRLITTKLQRNSLSSILVNRSECKPLLATTEWLQLFVWTLLRILTSSLQMATTTEETVDTYLPPTNLSHPLLATHLMCTPRLMIPFVLIPL